MGHPIIDTHVHSWNLERAAYPWLEGDTSILNRSYTLEELESGRQLTNVTAGVLVQAAGNTEDTQLLLELAEQYDWIKGVVGWLPLTDPAATARLLESKYATGKYFKAVRHQVHDEKDPEWLLQPAVIDSLRLLAQKDVPYDMVGVMPAHITTAIKLAEKIPGLRMVFDHLNQPPVTGNKTFGEWGALMQTAAQHSNFYAKISGLGTASKNFQGWTAADLMPCIEFVLKHFGTARCFCGGDWPVCLLAGSYAHTWKTYEDILQALLPEDEQGKLLFDNAKLFYRLEC